MYTWGIALENLLKGRAIELYLIKNPNAAFNNINQLKDEVWHTKTGHGLLSLVESCNVTLTDEEFEFFQRLEIFVSWAGKYFQGQSARDLPEGSNKNLIRLSPRDRLIFIDIERKIHPEEFLPE